MSLNADAIRRHLGDATEKLETLEVFAEIESTNSYLMQQPGPREGHVRVAATDNQTAGRGRYGRSWQSPAGSGLCLSLAYTFSSRPENLPAMTLAVGLGVVNALQEHGVAGVQLKWPNDLVAMDSKLGGILTEAQSQAGGTITIVTGIGLNVDLGDHSLLKVEADWAQRVIDLKSFAGSVPDKNVLASSLVSRLCRLLPDYEAGGFEQFREQWQQYDWLRGRTVTIETQKQQITGVGTGIAEDGALLVDTGSAGIQRVSSGTVTGTEVAELVP
jgi:BirA family biotin operon repressor/biotin-[acetyl-CoA-carboxylase] ligase